MSPAALILSAAAVAVLFVLRGCSGSRPRPLGDCRECAPHLQRWED